jgi:hypothetical protein
MPAHKPRLPGLELALLAFVTAYVAAMALSMNRSDYDIWGAFLIGPALVALNLPLLLGAMRREAEPRLAKLVAWAFLLKMLGAIPRYLVAFVLYGGTADAAKYHGFGKRLAPQFRSGDFDVDVGRVVGTGFMKLLTGLVYTVTGPSIVGGFLVFSVLGFWGVYLCYRAFVLALPDANHWRYGCLVFLLPSMLFWPSGIGKEAWMMLCIGVSAYGTARLFTRSRHGFAILGLGLLGAAMVRPHMAVILLVASFAGYLFRPAGPRATMLSPVAKLFGVVLLLGITLVVVHRAAAFFQVGQLNSESVDEVLASTQERTDEGGSSFGAERATGPLAVPRAAVQVLVRPFPWEAHNPQALVTSLEGVLLIALAMMSRRSLRKLPVHLRRSYVLFCALYSCIFVYAFSTFGNFGIIARERVQVLPFVLALLCLQHSARIRTGNDQHTRETTETMVRA